MSRQLGNTPFNATEKNAYFSMNQSENTIHAESQLKKLELIWSVFPNFTKE